MLSAFAVENYRSLRRVVISLGRVTLVTGTNGSGKSSLCRSLRLLAEVSRNGAVGALGPPGRAAVDVWAGSQQLGRAVREGRHTRCRGRCATARWGCVSGSPMTTPATPSTSGSRPR